MGIIALLTVMGIYSVSAFITSTFLTRQLIAEKKFHLLTDNDQIRVVAGARRKPLKISEAEKHLATIHAVARTYRGSWPLVLFRLYGPKKTRELDTSLDKVRKQAIVSQQANLSIKAMDKGYNEDPVMSLIGYAKTDESFKIIEERIDAGEFGVPISITADEAKVSKKTWSHRDSAPIVLLSVNKKKIAKTPSASAFSPSPSKISGKGMALPEGYSWDLELLQKGDPHFEKMSVILLKNGEYLKSDDFYTHIWGTPTEQKMKIKELQKKLVTAAHHDLHSGGVDKSFLG